ncbi:MraZ protein [Thiogranum longum]|uniref:Transcriptional regulator MraZ n=1 Tax=Thiogranum longum TaxID=1537524 RepID=A0A4V2PGL9_9GAMM|nr:division/cell wall cluster transcriptional repressor MraZ [Thiogranum longum]TCK17306.1 MraZ protein [Thiogranum longum]
MFRGGSTVKLDAKGRLALPTRYRGEIGERYEGRLVVTVHDDGCLLLYPQPEWEQIEHRLINTPNLDRRTRDMQRMLVGYATEVEMDGNGRILLTPRLRDFAELDKAVALVGVGKKFEIWNDETWMNIGSSWKGRAEDSDKPSPLESLTL